MSTNKGDLFIGIEFREDNFLGNVGVRNSFNANSHFVAKCEDFHRSVLGALD